MRVFSDSASDVPGARSDLDAQLAAPVGRDAAAAAALENFLNGEG